MAQDLLDDVWSQIAETLWSDRGTLRNMSLTSKRMHRLFVPLLFRSISFHIFSPSFESLMVRLIRNIIRAQFLFNSPELLRHTHSFMFTENPDTLDSMAEYFTLDEGSDSSSWRGDAENLLAVLHDASYRLILRMPGLRELRLSGTVITPLSYTAISSRPLLTSLDLEPSCLQDVTHVTPALPYAHRLRDFRYQCYTWTINDSPDPHLTDILEYCILNLESLTIDFSLLPLVVSRIPLHRTLSLQTLSPISSDDPESSASPAVAAFLQVLNACPQLLNLYFVGEFPEDEPTPYLPPPILQNLSTFVGPSSLLKILSGGTNLVQILLRDKFYLNKNSLTQVIRSPPTHLRMLFMHQVIVSHTPRELLTFIRSLAVFRNLERPTIRYHQDMSWKDHVSAQDSHSTIKYILGQLPCLRFLEINSLYGIAQGYDIGCPISKQGEPADRGHPSLENICVDFICNLWSWDSQKGWKRNWGGMWHI